MIVITCINSIAFFSRNITQHTQRPSFSPQCFLLTENGYRFTTGTLSLIIFTLIKKDSTLLAEHPGLPKTQTKLCKQSQSLLTIRKRFRIESQCLINGTSIEKRMGISFFIVQCAETGQYLF